MEAVQVESKVRLCQQPQEKDQQKEKDEDQGTLEEIENDLMADLMKFGLEDGEQDATTTAAAAATGAAAAAAAT